MNNPTIATLDNRDEHPEEYNPFEPNRYYVRQWPASIGLYGLTRLIWGAFWSANTEPDYVSTQRSVVATWAREHAERTMQVAESQYRHHPPLIRLILAVVDAAGQRKEFETSPFFHLRVNVPECLPLFIEARPSVNPLLTGETHRISVAQYTCLLGKIVPDTKFHLTNTGDPIEFYLYRAWHSVYWRDPDGAVTCRDAARHDADTIARDWATQLERHGFIDAAHTRFAAYANVEQPSA